MRKAMIPLLAQLNDIRLTFKAKDLFLLCLIKIDLK